MSIKSHIVIINQDNLKDDAKKAFIANLFAAMHQFLTTDTPIEIKISSGVKMDKAAEALRSIAEVIDTAANIVNFPKDGDEDEEPWSRPWEEQ